jgi:Ca2+-binding RTX toxin-like protein
MYGANFNTNSGNTVYGWNPATGQESINGVAQLAPQVNRVFQTIWDGNGIDTYNLSNYTTNLVIDLNPGGKSIFSDTQLAVVDTATNRKATGNVFNALQYNNDARSLIENANGGSGNDRITGNAAANTLNGNTGNDTLIGNAGNDVLNGGAGNDTMIGGAGADTMTGGAGNDIYVVDNAGDRTIEATNGGTDRVRAAVSYVLGSGQSVENLQTLGTATTTAINLTGNSLVNVLIGNAAANTLNGAGGADTMNGVAGNDIYIVDNAADRVVEVAGAGTDAVRVTVSYVLGSGQAVEILQTISSSATTAINLTGNQLVNTVVGNAGVNVINGGLGNDTLIGAGGSDFFLFNTTLNSSANADRITDFNVAADTIRLENAIFTALGATTGTLAAGKFFIGSAAHDADDRIVYHAASGNLIYDSNGNASGGAILFAKLATGLALTNADFFVI